MNKKAILTLIVFFVVTNAIAVDETFGGLTAAELSALTRGQIILLLFKVAASAGTVILAYLNQSAAKAPPPAS